MKYILSILFIAVLLTGCGSNSSSDEGSSVDNSGLNSIANGSPDDGDQLFAHLTKEQIPPLQSLSDDKVIEMGHNACDALKDIHSKFEMSVFIGVFNDTVTTITDEQGAKWVGFAIAAYCPEKAVYLG